MARPVTLASGDALRRVHSATPVIDNRPENRASAARFRDGSSIDADTAPALQFVVLNGTRYSEPHSGRFNLSLGDDYAEWMKYDV